MYDSIVIGFGPAGCTAAIFTYRRGMKTLVLGDPESLSQVEEATIVDDWPGDMNIKGEELIEKIRNHVRKLGIEVREEKAIEIKKTKKGFVVRTNKGECETKTVIVATGGKHRQAMIKGESEFSGKGVSYCATCDGPLFRGKRVVVIGGGDSAVTYALLLKDLDCDVTLIHRRDELRATEYWQKKFFKSKIKALWDSVVTEIKGDSVVRSIVVFNKKTKKSREIPVDGVFVAIGSVPTSEIAKKICFGILVIDLTVF